MINRISESKLNNSGSKMTIINYKSSMDITVQFENGHITHTSYSEFKKGSVKNIFEKTFLFKGYIGEGVFKSSVKGRITKEYIIWRGMLMRCYNSKYHLTHPSYIGCTVCEEWLNFQNYAEWHKSNYYEIPGEKTSLDKDILVKGNKMYSPETCLFVPQSINSLFINTKKVRGDYPIGVRKRKDAYSAKGFYKKEQTHLGTFYKVEDAYNAFKIFKEITIKKIAEEYKDKIPQKLYEALYKYEVEITD